MAYMSATHTVNDVLTYIKRQFGDESGVQIDNADIMRWINAGQDEIFRKVKPIKATATADLLVNQSGYTFPANVLFVQAIHVNGSPIPSRSFEEAEEYAISQDPLRVETGNPQFWYEFGGTFTFWPKPSTTITGGIMIYYVKSPTAVVATTDLLSVPDSMYMRLIEWVMSQAYELDENMEGYQMKTNQFNNGVLDLSGDDATIDDTYPRITVYSEDM